MDRQGGADLPKDAHWVAHMRWRSRSRSMMVRCIRRGILRAKEAEWATEEVQTRMVLQECGVLSSDCRRVAVPGGCAAHHFEGVP